MWALVKNSVVSEIISAPRSILIGDVNYPESIFTFWSKEELAAIDIYPVVINPPPDGLYEIANESAPLFDAAAKQVNITLTYAALPEPVPPDVTPLQLVRALRELGIEAAFDTYLDAHPALKKDFFLSGKVDFDDQDVIAGAAAIAQATGKQIDLAAVFRLAKTK
jgi:hypothetical protein